MKTNPFLSLLKNKNFLKIWGSQFLNQTTLSLVNFVIMLKIYEVTDSTVAISLVWIFYVLPTLLLGPFTGTIVDFIERRKILFFTNIFQSVIVLFYLLVKTKIWPIYGVVFLYSLVSQFYMPAEAATLPKVTVKKLFPPANTLFLLTIYAAMFVGFSLAGPLVSVAGNDLPFILSSSFLLTAAGIVWFLPKFKPNGDTRIGGPQKFWKRFKSGYIFISKKPEIFFPIMLLVLTQVIINPLLLLAPSYATKILKLDLLSTSYTFVLPLGAGALFGAQAVIMALRKVRKIKVIKIALLLATCWIFILGLIIPSVFAFWRLPLTIMALFFLGASYVALIIPSQTLIQEKTPERFRGRVFGALFFSINVGLVLSMFASATVADLLGVTWAMTAVGVLVAVMWFFSLRDFNEYGFFMERKFEKLRGVSYE